MREHRLLRGRANREAVVLDRHLALGCLPEGEGARRRSLREVVDVARDHVPRPRLVEPTRPLRDRLVLEVVHLDVADAVELLEVGHCLVHERGILGVDVRDPLAQERHADRLPVLGEERHLALVRLGLPEDVPRLAHAGDVLLDLVRPPGDAGGVDGVGNGVARLAVVERVDELRPDVLLEVRDVVEVERLDQLAGNADIERVRRDLHHVGRDRSGGEPLESGVDVVERRVLDVDAVLGPEIREDLLVEVGGIVEDGERPACLRLEPRRDRILPTRQGHALVGPRERQASRPDEFAARAGALGDVRRVAAGGEQGAGSGEGHGDTCASQQEIAPAQGVRPFLRVVRHSSSLLSSVSARWGTVSRTAYFAASPSRLLGHDAAFSAGRAERSA